jgi:hypothetical protein
MSIRLSSWLRGATLAGALLAAGCAGFNASALQPGVSTLPQIEAALGKPAMVWTSPDGTSQLAYPFGPFRHPDLHGVRGCRRQAPAHHRGAE